MKLMMNTAWVVYLMTVSGKHPGRHAVCSQTEWSEIEASQPGYHKFVQRIVGSEGEAEKYARSIQIPLEVPTRKRVTPFKRPVRSNSPAESVAAVAIEA